MQGASENIPLEAHLLCFVTFILSVMLTPHFFQPRTYELQKGYASPQVLPLSAHHQTEASAALGAISLHQIFLVIRLKWGCPSTVTTFLLRHVLRRRNLAICRRGHGFSLLARQLVEATVILGSLLYSMELL